MDPIPTLDVLLNEPTIGRDRLAQVTRAAIAAATADWAAINELDRLAGPADWRSGSLAVTTTVRRQWEAWLAAAETLRVRAQTATTEAGTIANLNELDAAIGRTYARLAITLEDMAASIQDGLEGRQRHFASVEEMRRELLHRNN